MRLIFNSDVLYQSQLITGELPSSLQRLLHVCCESGITVVIPSTTLLEFSKYQADSVQQAIAKLQDAYAQLDKYGISYERVEPSDAVKQPDLIELIKRTGVAVEVAEPTLEDFSEAHRRACLHVSPHPPKVKSDEMRDLVIWVIALRLASQHGRAILVSRDELHIHARGDDEANRARLLRIKRFEEATEYLGVENPSGDLVKKLLAPVWTDLINAGLPLADPMSLTAVSKARFIQGTRGPSSAYCTWEAVASEGDRITADAEIRTAGGIITTVIMSNISVDGAPWRMTRLEIAPNKQLGKEIDDYTDRLNALKKIVEG